MLCLGMDAGNTRTGRDDFIHRIRESIRLGGCSASRAAFVGACSSALNLKDFDDQETGTNFESLSFFLDCVVEGRNVLLPCISDFLAKLVFKT